MILDCLELQYFGLLLLVDLTRHINSLVGKQRILFESAHGNLLVLVVAVWLFQSKATACIVEAHLFDSFFSKSDTYQEPHCLPAKMHQQAI